MRVWNHMIGKIETEFVNENEVKDATEKIKRQGRRVGSSRLAELSLIVDTSGKYSGEDIEELKNE